MKIKSIDIKRYRSINNLKINVIDGTPLILCGANNVGKTNFLRALKLFFELDKNQFDVKCDIPYDIAEGKRGKGYNSSITVTFVGENNIEYNITATFTKKKELGNILDIKAKEINNANKDVKAITKEYAEEIIKSHRFLFIEASNINIPKVIEEIIDSEVLPLGLDRKRSHQTTPLKKLKDFIEESKKSVVDIENEIGGILNDFITKIPGINNENWKIKILFPQYEKLREALSGLIDFTLYDGNDRKMETKGSGIQRTILLALMQYISKRSNKNIIWGVDEPEAFLQPSLQKQTADIFREISKKDNVLLTTHSQHFINVSNLDNTYLFEAKYEKKEYARRKNETFYKVSTFTNERISSFEKAQNIKKHLGMERNDNWEIMPFNLLVEGEEDKNYITILVEKCGFKIPNILVSGGTTKIKGYLQFLLEFCKETNFKSYPPVVPPVVPRVVCLLDHDEAGKKEYEPLSNPKSIAKYKKYFNLEVKFINRFDGKKDYGFNYEIEDLIYPDILREVANKFLKNKGYRKISLAQLNTITSAANDKNCILKNFTDFTRTNNPRKNPLNLEGERIKLSISKLACEHIKSIDIGPLDSKYPEVKKFIERIIK